MQVVELLHCLAEKERNKNKKGTNAATLLLKTKQNSEKNKKNKSTVAQHTDHDILSSLFLGFFFFLFFFFCICMCMMMGFFPTVLYNVCMALLVSLYTYSGRLIKGRLAVFCKRRKDLTFCKVVSFHYF